jgi:L-lactate dehydrogenase complex protein LldE
MRVALFVPCYIEHIRPSAGLAAAALLDRVGVSWTYPDRQTCCGQPAYNAGFAAETLPAARYFLRVFAPFDIIVAPSASCVAMVRRYWTLPGLSPTEAAVLRELGGRCWEFCQWLVDVRGAIELGARLDARAAFQDCCHALRELHLAAAPRRLLAAVEGLELVDQPGLDCCGFGGLYSVKMPELSAAQADDRLCALAAAGTDTLIATDASCLLHLEGRARRRALPFRGLHVVEVLAGMAPHPSDKGVAASARRPEAGP